mgnify:FL=1
MTTPLHLRLLLPKVPDLSKVGGNARPGHHQQAARWTSEERQEWIGLIRAQLVPPYPHFYRAKATVALWYPQHRDRDMQDNVPRALKPLWDVLKPERWVGLVNQGGYFGIIFDDNEAHLKVESITVKVDKAKAPLTELRMEVLS